MNASQDDRSFGLEPELTIRGLRAFVAAAEELHFTRAATRLFVAQQVLSRDIQRLERELGVALFVRSTRRVLLTAEGERLLPRARELLALHDRLPREVRAPDQPVIAFLLSEGRLTGRRVLDAARQAAPHLEFRARHGPGLVPVLASLLSGEVHVAFGRVDRLDRRLPAELDVRLIRFEPLALLLPASHGLAKVAEVQLAALAGVEIDAGIGNPRAIEWSDLAQQFLAIAGARAAPPHVPVEGVEEQAHHLAKQGLPILTTIDHRPVPGGEFRRLVRPMPLFAWSLVYRRDSDVAGVAALQAAAERLATDEHWLEIPADAWLPEPEATRIARSSEAT